MRPIAYVGLTLHGVLFIALVGVCAFDDGKLTHDWRDCLIPLGLLALPFILASVGVARGSSAALGWGAAIGCVLGIVSLTGPGLFVLLPSILYGIAAVQTPRESHST